MVTRKRLQRKVDKEKEDKLGRGWTIFDWVVVIVFLLIIIVGGLSALVPPEDSEKEQKNIPVSGDAIVQVFNGSGDISAANIVKESLTMHGVDVQDVVKNANAIYPYTILIDRKGDEFKIDSLISITGIPNERVILQRNYQMFDATLVLGRDWKMALSKFFSQDNN